MLTDANAGVPQHQLSWIVQLQLNHVGGKIFEQVTGALAKKSEPQNTFAIVLDGKVVTYPRVTTAISGGRAGDLRVASRSKAPPTWPTC